MNKTGSECEVGCWQLRVDARSDCVQAISVWDWSLRLDPALHFFPAFLPCWKNIFTITDRVRRTERVPVTGMKVRSIHLEKLGYKWLCGEQVWTDLCGHRKIKFLHKYGVCDSCESSSRYLDATVNKQFDLFWKQRLAVLKVICWCPCYQRALQESVLQPQNVFI